MSDDATTRTPAPPPARHARNPPAPGRVRRVVGVTLAGVLALGASAAVAAYQRLLQNIDGVDVERYLGDDRPEGSAGQGEPDDSFAGRAVNLMVIGIDSRDGENAEIGGEDDGMRSDSTYLVHLPADRSRVDVIAVPRDLLVDQPACELPDGSMTKPRSGAMFNAAFDVGGGPTRDLATAAACTRRTFEQSTGIRTDEHVVVTMAGVRDVVDTLGGVPICLPEAMDSPMAGLSVPAGDQVFDGDTAIEYLRARKGTGNGLWLGSDLARLDRQQAFIEAVAAKVRDQDTLHNPVRLAGLIDDVTRSISVSSGLADLAALAGLGFSLRDVDVSDVTTMTIPTVAAPSDANRVVWGPDAPGVWQRVADDLPLDGGPGAGDPGAPDADVPPSPREDGTPERGACG